MSGHSKWSTIKHKKAANDKVKGSVFTKMAKAITIAVKKGGGVGDVEANFALRLAVDKARAVNMPKENIDRAIAKGMGKSEGEELAELTIEAFGPEGTMMIVEIVTDSRNRVVAEMRNLIEKHGGRMGEPGSVMYLFERVGIARVEQILGDDIQLEAIDHGMTEMVNEGGATTMYSTADQMHSMVLFLESKGYRVEATLGYRPKLGIRVVDEARIGELLDAITNYEDVQELYVNLA